MKIDLHTEYSTITCCAKKCGMTFAVPSSWEDNRRSDKTTFYCPNGHPQWYPAETKVQKLRKQIKHIERENERCMLNLQKKNQDLVLLRMTDKEELFAKEDSDAIHIKKANGASEISFMCGYKAPISLLNKVDNVPEGQWLCSRCLKAVKSKQLEID